MTINELASQAKKNKDVEPLLKELYKSVIWKRFQSIYDTDPIVAKLKFREQVEKALASWDGKRSFSTWLYYYVQQAGNYFYKYKQLEGLTQYKKTLKNKVDTAYFQLLKRYNREPTLEEIANQVGVSVKTIKNLYKEITLDSLIDAVPPQPPKVGDKFWDTFNDVAYYAKIGYTPKQIAKQTGLTSKDVKEVLELIDQEISF